MTTPSFPSSLQREIFLNGEGDRWYQRNLQSSAEGKENWHFQDPLASLLSQLPLSQGQDVSVLEVGCTH